MKLRIIYTSYMSKRTFYIHPTRTYFIRSRTNVFKESHVRIRERSKYLIIRYTQAHTISFRSTLFSIDEHF